MDIDTIIKILGALGAVLVAIQQIVKAFDRPRPRQALLEDLEILSKTPDDLPEKALLTRHVSASFEKLYSPGAKQKKIDWSSVVMMPIFAAGLAYWTYQLSKDGFSIWSVVTGVFAVGALGAWVDEFVGEKDEEATTPADPEKKDG